MKPCVKNELMVASVFLALNFLPEAPAHAQPYRFQVDTLLDYTQHVGIFRARTSPFRHGPGLSSAA